MTTWAKHSITDKVVEVGKDIPEEYLDHPVFGQWYSIVDSPDGCVGCGNDKKVEAEVEPVTEEQPLEEWVYDTEDEED